MPLMMTGKIDVTKIEKARLFAGKNGAKYLDIVLIPTPNNAYGDDYMIVQSVTKEERDLKVRGPILGNARTIGHGGRPPTGDPTPPSSVVDGPPESDDVPF